MAAITQNLLFSGHVCAFLQSKSLSASHTWQMISVIPGGGIGKKKKEKMRSLSLLQYQTCHATPSGCQVQLALTLPMPTVSACHPRSQPRSGAPSPFHWVFCLVLHIWEHPMNPHSQADTLMSRCQRLFIPIPP